MSALTSEGKSILSERLIQLRKDRCLTQAETARLISVKRERYNAWEHAFSQPDAEMLIELATFHGVSIDYLIGNSNMKHPLTELSDSSEPLLRVINRVAKTFNTEQRKEAIQMWELLFKEKIEDARKQEGVPG